MSVDPTRRSLLAGLAATMLPGVSRAETAALVARDGVVTIGLKALERIDPGGWLLARVSFPPRSTQVLGTDSNDPGFRMLQRLWFEGRAAGNDGDLYDNLDRGHSPLPPWTYPGITRVEYDETARSAGLDYGLQLGLLFDAPVIGNSSTALTSGPLWRSLPRMALTRADGPERLARIYSSGALRVFPEHRDHDPENGDLLPANVPYLLISQGSSGSDQPILRALAAILAAFRPDTKARLKETELVGPTLQMVFRRGRSGMGARAAYLSGAAHPTVFDGKDISLAQMVALANAIGPDEVPPLVRLEVQEETLGREGVDFFGDGLSENLFNTPAAIARVWRSATARREMVVSVAGTRDPSGRELKFHWVMLRGDPKNTRIETLDEAGHRARIVLDWQAPRAPPATPDIVSPRIDIGVFADNGAFLSAPSIISFLLPAHETRVYERGADGVPRPVSIDRGAGERYADPILFPATGWRDVYQYDEAGRARGWIREIGPERQAYDSAGRRLSDSGPQDVRYPIEIAESGATMVTIKARSDA